MKWAKETRLQLGPDFLTALPAHYKLSNEGQLEDISAETLRESVRNQQTIEDDSLTGDNEEVYDENEKTQQLSREQIDALKQTLDGEALALRIAGGNSNFARKFKITKEKYIERKKKKHQKRWLVERLSLPSLVSYYVEHKSDYAFPRDDYFAHFVNLCTPQGRQNVFVFDKSRGSVLAHLWRRAAEDFTGRFYVYAADGRFIPNKFEALSFLGMQPPRDRLCAVSDAQSVEDGLDWILIASNEGEREMLAKFFSALRKGGSVCVFTPFAERARGIVDYLFSTRECIDVKTRDYFYRCYQVLPHRTHPTMKGNNAGGYIVTACKI